MVQDTSMMKFNLIKNSDVNIKIRTKLFIVSLKISNVVSRSVNVRLSSSFYNA